MTHGRNSNPSLTVQCSFCSLYDDSQEMSTEEMRKSVSLREHNCWKPYKKITVINSDKMIAFTNNFDICYFFLCSQKSLRLIGYYYTYFATEEIEARRGFTIFPR